MIGEADIFLGVFILIMILVVVLIRIGLPRMFGHWMEGQVEQGIERNSEREDENAKNEQSVSDESNSTEEN